MNLIYSFVTAMQLGKTDDSEVILFWSGVYILISWIIFIWLPKKVVNKLKFGKYIHFASPIMGIYSGLVYTILLGKIFDFSETYIFFLPYAILTGVIYGIILTCINFNPKAQNYMLISTPIIALVYYFLFPLILPTQAFRFMPDITQDKIVSRIIPKLKVGDEYKLYLNKLPNLNSYKGLRSEIWVTKAQDIPEDYSTSMNASNEFISYSLEVENGIITKINYELKE